MQQSNLLRRNCHGERFSLASDATVSIDYFIRFERERANMHPTSGKLVGVVFFVKLSLKITEIIYLKQILQNRAIIISVIQKNNFS